MGRMNVSDSDFIKKVDALIADPRAVDAHRKWESADSEWKSAMKAGEPTPILSSATSLRVARSRKDDIMDRCALDALALSEQCGVIENYDHDRLGTAAKSGEVEELSAEWHDLRRFGLGGSDLSEAMGFHWKSRSGYIVKMDREELDQHWYSMAAKKSTPVSSAHVPTRGVLMRGHAWEPALIARHALSTGTRVAVSKATWAGSLPYQRINTDGIILDSSGKAVGLLECKTSSREWTWQWGVPLHYRAQVLWYLNATGLDYADVLVKFDSGTVDCHRIHADETIDGTSQTRPLKHYIPALNERWEELERLRDHPEDLYELSSTLIAETRQVLGACSPGGDVDSSVLDGGEIVMAHVASPYERMEDYDRIYRFDTEDASHSIVGVSPVFYPVPVAKKTEDLDEIIGDGTLLAVDSVSYSHLRKRYGADGLCNLSALRRMADNLPGREDFSSVDEARKWLDSIR